MLGSTTAITAGRSATTSVVTSGSRSSSACRAASQRQGPTTTVVATPAATASATGSTPRQAADDLALRERRLLGGVPGAGAPWLGQVCRYAPPAHMVRASAACP